MTGSLCHCRAKLELPPIRAHLFFAKAVVRDGCPPLAKTHRTEMSNPTLFVEVLKMLAVPVISQELLPFCFSRSAFIIFHPFSSPLMCCRCVAKVAVPDPKSLLP